MIFYIFICFCFAIGFLDGRGGDARAVPGTADFGGVGATGSLLLYRIQTEGFVNLFEWGESNV